MQNIDSTKNNNVSQIKDFTEGKTDKLDRDVDIQELKEREDKIEKLQNRLGKIENKEANEIQPDELISEIKAEDFEGFDERLQEQIKEFMNYQGTREEYITQQNEETNKEEEFETGIL